MTPELRKRIADALGWTVQDTCGFSVSMLREMVRGKHPKLAYELELLIQSGAHILEPKSRL